MPYLLLFNKSVNYLFCYTFHYIMQVSMCITLSDNSYSPIADNLRYIRVYVIMYLTSYIALGDKFNLRKSVLRLASYIAMEAITRLLQNMRT